MKKILVSGDSWTSCWPLEEKLGHRNFGWPNLVSTYFNIELVDKSRAGSSNYRIYRKAFEGILDSSVDIVLVFLTSWTRIETGQTNSKKPGAIYQHQPGNDKEIFKIFFNGYKNYSDNLRMIISLQNLALQYKTQCYFLDTFENNIYRNISLNDFKNILKLNPAVFDNLNDEQIEKKFLKIKVLEKSIDWSTFISNKSYQELIQDCNFDKGHPVEDGHKKISQIVINFLEEATHGKTI